jgi:hypothetical protein
MFGRDPQLSPWLCTVSISVAARQLVVDYPPSSTLPSALGATDIGKYNQYRLLSNVRKTLLPSMRDARVKRFCFSTYR